MSVNETIFRLLNDLAGGTPFFDWLVVFVGRDLGWVLLVVLLFYLVFFARPLFERSTDAARREWFRLALSIIFSWLASEIVKSLFLVARPPLILPDAVLLLPLPADDAFPSAHAAVFFALGLALYLHRRRWGSFYIWGAVAIGLARIVAGLHWPADVLAGFALGGAIAWAVYFVPDWLYGLRRRS